MFICHLRVQPKTNEEIKILYELLQFNIGTSQNISEIPSTTRYWTAT